MSFSLSTVTLSDLSVIEVSGADAVSFLHGQLSHDMNALVPGQARLAGYCTAKGRLLGTMIVWLAAGTEVPTLRLLTKANIAEAVAKRLSMFVLRAKVKIAVTQIPVLGITTAADQTSSSPDLPGLAEKLPPNPAPMQVEYTDAGDAIAAPQAGNQAVRWWLAASNPVDTTSSKAAQASWQAADMAAGLPWIESATQDMFIPQTLNLDLIDGVSFSKGCYPGQEVVARSHYRGTVKRRMAYGTLRCGPDTDASTLAGSDTFDASNPEQPVGRIVNAAATTPAEPGTEANNSMLIHVLMEVQLADLGQADFRLNSSTGPIITVQDLPYSIKA